MESGGKDVDVDSDNWIVDSLVMYLRGPIWNLPILNFIEQKSVVFETGEDEEVEYRKIYDEFRNLVDAMLGAYMDDMGLQPENLESALSQVQPSVRSEALQELLKPVQSAGYFEKFKQMMFVKNAELHNQVLELINQEKDDSSKGETIKNDEDATQDLDLKEAIRLSLEEQEVMRNASMTEKRDVERALAISVASLLTERTEESVPVVDKLDTSASEGCSQTPDPCDVELRRSLLRAQRDKILQLKRQEREFQMNYQEKARLAARPKSGQVARESLAGMTTPNVDEKTLRFRRLLLQKIKEEVEGHPKT